MKKSWKDSTPNISLPVLGTLCFVTLLMCQIRFKITKEVNHEALMPPIMRSKDCWFLYTIGNSKHVQCVLRAFIVVSSPVVSLVSTVLLLYGKTGSNPYYFIPWLFLTLKGLLLVQTDNLITIFKDMTTNSSHAFGSRMEDLKWILFYFTFFLIDLVEAFSFCEIFDLFLLLWNRSPTYIDESESLEAVRKEIADIVENLTKCSSVKSSTISSEDITESEDVKEILTKGDSVKISSKFDEKVFDEPNPVKSPWNAGVKSDYNENILQKQFDLRIKMNTHSEGDAFIKKKQDMGKVKNFSSTDLTPAPKSTIEVDGSKLEEVEYM